MDQYELKLIFICVAIVLQYKQDWKKKYTIRKQEMQQNEVRFCFFLQNENESGSGDVVSAPKPKTFEVQKIQTCKHNWKTKLEN